MTKYSCRRGLWVLVCAFNAAALGVSVKPVFAQCITPPSGLTGWWTGDGTGADAQNGRNATLQNGATYGTGEVGQAFQFDGVDDLASVPNDPALNVGSGDFTVDFW